MYFFASVWMTDGGKHIAWNFTKMKWGLLLKRYEGGHLLSRFLEYATNLTTEQDAKEFRMYFKANLAPGCKRTIEQTIEQILINADWLKREKNKLKKWLADREDTKNM